MATTTPTPLPPPLHQKGTSVPPSPSAALPLPVSQSPSYTSQPTSSQYTAWESRPPLSPSQSQTSRPPSPPIEPSIDDISGFPRINIGCTVDETDHSEFNTAAYPYPNSNATPVAGPDFKTNEDPFATQREGGEANRSGNEAEGRFTFAAKERNGKEGDEGEDEGLGLGGRSPGDERERRLTRGLTDEAAEQAQSRTPINSRTPRGSKGSLGQDAHVSAKTNERDGRHQPGHFEKGWARMTGRRSSRGERD